MTAITPPADTSSLLVPVHLDAWVIGKQTQQVTAIYKADYSRLSQFKGLLDPPLSASSVPKLTSGVRLHWALPDALTHGRTPAGGGDTVFPLVPNRWLVARFNLPKGGAWQCRLWVIQSDYTGGTVGTTSAQLKTAGVTSIPLAAPGAQLAVAAGDELQIVSNDGTHAATVMAAVAAPKGATSISIAPFDFSPIKPEGLVKGSSVRLRASSTFLDPTLASSMDVNSEGDASFKIKLASIGKPHDIASWQAAGGASSEKLFLQAVGPGNVSFAAYMPTVNDVFSFTDKELPAEGGGVIYNYTYMVVGWYSDPVQGDPLRGVTAYDPAVWESQAEWQKQTPAQRMATLLAYLKWSVKDKDGNPVTSPQPFSTSLYHGLVAGVQWPPPSPGRYPGQIDPSKVHVAVGNTSADALAALVESEAAARGAKDKEHESEWTKAGKVLAQLMQAAMYDLLDKFDKPGGAVLVQQQIEQAWFGSDQGGTLWEVVAASQTSDQSSEPPQLTTAQSEAIATALAALNAAQTTFDENMRKLMSLQTQLYHIWWKVGRARSYSLHGGFASDPDTTPDWSILMPFVMKLYEPILKATWQQYCAVAQAESALPNPTPADAKDPRAPDRWADANPNWLFPDSAGVPKKVKLASLGLKLKASAMPNFWHPNDPVLMVSGLDRARRHGEDGRYSKDGTLTCRTPGQTITGLKIQGQPAINVDAVKGRVNLAPCGTFTSIPSVPSLMAEAFFVDPWNAPAIAAAVAGSNEGAIKSAVTNLLAEKPDAGTSWVGTSPVPFSIAPWDQAWSPLFLEWRVSYFPTGQRYKFAETDWQFDGAQYAWLGTGVKPKDMVASYLGRTLLTPHAPLTFKSKIEQYLKNHPEMDSARLNELISTVAGWDVLSQNLSGLTNQFITLASQETFPPPPAQGSSVQCPPSETQPDVALLIGDQHHSVPIIGAINSAHYFPVRAGFTQFQSLRIVDAFGQVYGGDIGVGEGTVWINTGNNFQPTLGQGLDLSFAKTVAESTAQAARALIPTGSFQLPPRLVQSARLDVEFLANDKSGQPIRVSANPNPVCGWLVPNHLDGGISVYDEKGAPLGELLALPPGAKCDNWRPRPGDPGTKPPPTCPENIPNEALRLVVKSIAAQSQDTFRDLLKTVDETLWMVDPLGGRKDQFLSVLIGRPLAVVQARLKLSLHGEPVFNQYWNKTCTNPDAQEESECEQLKDTGGVLDVKFPVRLGSLELRDDGLIGYYLPATDNYATFYTVHYPKQVAAGNKYLRRVVDPDPPVGGRSYLGDVFLKCSGDAVTVTMLVDPRGSVNAYTGVLPVVSASLPGQLVEDFIRELQVTFRTGPVIADPGTMRIPQPAEEHGVWSWVQAVASGGAKWAQEAIVDADDQARMPDAQLQLREGWLRLSDLSDSG